MLFRAPQKTELSSFLTASQPFLFSYAIDWLIRKYTNYVKRLYTSNNVLLFFLFTHDQYMDQLNFLLYTSII